MVPQDVPVAKLTNAAMTKTVAGIQAGAIQSPTAPIRNPAVSRSRHTAPRDQAKTRITAAKSIERMPDIQASIDLPNDNAPLPTERAKAARQPAPVAHRIAALELALHGGEDYELCFAARAGSVDPRRLASSLDGLLLSRVGRVVEGAGVKLEHPAGDVVPLMRGGFSHLEGSVE